MNKENRHRSRPAMFKSPLLEGLTFLRFSHFLIVWIPVVGANVYLSAMELRNPLASVASVLSALAMWWLIEYVLHRYVFHSGPDRGLTGLAHIHGCHHRDADDRLRNLTPLSVTIPVGILVYFSTQYLLGEYFGRLWFSSFAVGYVVFEIVHYWCHRARDGNRAFGFLIRHHGLHHHNGSGNFSVSLPILDRLMGTKLKAG